MTATQVARKLGGRRVLHQHITSDLELAEAVTAGLPSGALDHVFSELVGVVNGQRDVYRLVGSARTLQRKRSRKVSLSASESDRLARFARFLVRAEEAIGDRTKALRWLVRPNRALGGKQPLELLDSDAGAVAVERVLGRIEHGVFS
jgi:putative toxin-antitoxin system antitoxin component (TIGR02293 family)